MVWRFSKISASNATADSTVNFQEGQAPSSLNDSCRAVMSRVAQYRDDISGANVTGGTPTAYTVASNQSFDTLAHMDGKVIAFTPHVTSGANPFLNVDGLGLKPIRMQTGIAIPEGVLVAGTPYTTIYNNSSGELLLHNLAGNPYNIPLGAGIEYWGTTVPNSSFAFPFGQALSRTAFSTLFSLFSTTYGVGDGSTTFNLPDKRDKISIAKGNMGGSSAGLITTAVSGFDGDTLGASGGAQSIQLTLAQTPSATISGTTSGMGGYNAGGLTFGSNSVTQQNGTGGTFAPLSAPVDATGLNSHNHPFAASNGGGDQAHRNMPPGIVCNYIIRII
jgi:microcystin-dependent protein